MSSKQLNNVINLAEFQQKMDEIVFDYIDTKPNWEKAYTLLDELLEQSTRYFVDYVERNGELPSVSAYWVLFTDFNAKLIYFTTLALSHRTQKSKGITDEILSKRYNIAAKCIVNTKSEENINFMQEIEESFKEVSNGEAFEGKKEQTATNCIQTFYEFAQSY